MSERRFWKVEVNPCSEGYENRFLLQEYITIPNGKACIGNVLYVGSYVDCCNLKKSLDAGRLERDEVMEGYFRKQYEGYNITYSIYQVKENQRDMLFMPLAGLLRKGFQVERKRYGFVYMDRLADEDWQTDQALLEEIYCKFNIAHPEGYHGRSLSVSDVVVIRREGLEKAYFCDTVGFEEVPEFLKK